MKSKATCHPEAPFHAKGMCKKCYRRHYSTTDKSKAYVESLKFKKVKKPKKVTISKCHPDKKHYGKGLCERCYSRIYVKTPKARLARKEYERKNCDRIKSYKLRYSKEYNKNRRKTDVNFKLRCTLRERLKDVIRGHIKQGSAVSDLGCSVEFLKAYIESLWLDGMTWDNYTKDGWHLDHKRPLASFDLENRDEFLKACHYTNLQPLWATDNLSKGARLDWSKDD